MEQNKNIQDMQDIYLMRARARAHAARLRTARKKLREAMRAFEHGDEEYLRRIGQNEEDITYILEDILAELVQLHELVKKSTQQSTEKTEDSQDKDSTNLLSACGLDVVV